MQLKRIPKKEQENVLSNFWTMLRECESKADDNNSPVLKHWVNQWYGMWNRLTGDDKQARWVTPENPVSDPFANARKNASEKPDEDDIDDVTVEHVVEGLSAGGKWVMIGVMEGGQALNPCASFSDAVALAESIHNAPDVHWKQYRVVTRTIESEVFDLDMDAKKSRKVSP